MVINLVSSFSAERQNIFNPDFRAFAGIPVGVGAIFSGSVRPMSGWAS